MEKLDFEKKLKELTRQQEQIMANFNAVGGAIQLCKEFIKQEEEKEILHTESEEVINVIANSNN